MDNSGQMVTALDDRLSATTSSPDRNYSQPVVQPDMWESTGEGSYCYRLPIQYHQQDISTYCGAACAQMILQLLDAQDKCAPDMDPIDQYDLQVTNYAKSIESGWQTDPFGLHYTLDNREPSPPKGEKKRYDQLKIWTSKSPEAISRMIVWSIFKYQVPAAVLVWGRRHWVVVSGFRADKKPESSDDTSYNILEFFINDPIPVGEIIDISKPQPPPHHRDDGCGTGGWRGQRDHPLPYETWLLEQFFSPVPEAPKDGPDQEARADESNKWAGLFVAICASKKSDDLAELVHVRHPHPRTEVVQDKTVVQKKAVAILEQHGPKEEAWYVELFGDGIKPEAGNPVLVHYRPEFNGKRVHCDYFLIPIVKGEKVRAALRVDADDLDYRESIGVDPDQQIPYGIPTLTQNAEHLIDKTFQFPFGRGSLRPIRDLERKLVWEPCIESYSPMAPFYRFYIGEHLYGCIRIDGRAFRTLRTNSAGV